MRITEMVIKERHIEKLWQECSNKNCAVKNHSRDQTVLAEFVKYIKIDDLFRNTNNGIIVDLLYFEKPKITMTEICRKMFIDEKTLYRYRKSYIKLFDLIDVLYSNRD